MAIGAIRSLLSRTASSRTFFSQSRLTNSLLNYHCTRSFSTELITQDLNSSVAAALNLDSRVPATVITGFLGAGKVKMILQTHILTLHGTNVP